MNRVNERLFFVWCYFCWAPILFCVLNMSVPTANAQGESLTKIAAVADLIPMDVSATAHIPDFPLFFKQLREHEAFKSPQFLLDLEQILDSNVDLKNDWKDSLSLLNSVSEAHLMIWVPASKRDTSRWDQQIVSCEFVLALKFVALEPQVDMLNSLCPFVTTPFGPYASNDLGDDFEIVVADKYLLIGNSKAKVSRLMDSFSGRKLPDKKLSRDRRFASASVDFKKSEKDSFFLFARPSHFSGCFATTIGMAETGKRKLFLRELPSISMVAGFHGANQDFVIKTRTAHTLPVSGFGEIWEGLPSLSDFPPCNLNVTGVEMFVNEIFINYTDDYGLVRTMRLSRQSNFESRKKKLDSAIEKGRLKQIKLEDGPTSDDEAIVIGKSQTEREKEWSELVERLDSEGAKEKRNDKKYREAIGSLGKSAREVGIDLLDNDGQVLTRKWSYSGQLQDIFAFVDNSNASEDVEMRLAKVSDRAKWLSRQFDKDEVIRIQAGDKLSRTMESFARAAFVLKSGAKLSRAQTLIKGGEYRKWKTGKNYRGNLHTLATWLVWNAAMEHCDSIVKIWCPKERQGKMESAIGFFFKPEAGKKN